MKKVIVLAVLIALIISVMMMTGCQESPGISPDPFTTTWSLGGEGRSFNISGNSVGHAASKPSEFQIAMNNRSGNDIWRESYYILLVNREEIVKEIVYEDFEVPIGQEVQKHLTVTFPADVVKGAIGLCAVIPQRVSMVTTLWVGEKKSNNIGSWPDITTCPYFFTEEGSRALAEKFVCNCPTFLFDGIEESLVLKETVDLLKEHKPGSPEPLSQAHGWSFIFEFENRHAGYGDRSEQVLNEVITPHEAVIMVEAGEVTSAVMDGVWNMIAQHMLSKKVGNSVPN